MEPQQSAPQQQTKAPAATTNQNPRRQPEPYLYHAVIRRELQYQPCAKDAAANDHKEVATELRTEVICAGTKAELKEKLNAPSVVEIIGIFRGRQLKFEEKRNVRLC